MYLLSLRWIIDLVYTTREHSKNKQDNTFCRNLFVFISGLFVNKTSFCKQDNKMSQFHCFTCCFINNKLILPWKTRRPYCVALFVFLWMAFCWIYFIFSSETLAKQDILRWKQYPEFEMSIMGYRPISRDSEPIKLRYLRMFMCSLY